MQRYSLDCTSFDLMDKDNQGCWVRYDEARAEIERMEKEVERLKEELEISKRGAFGNNLQRCLAQFQRDTAWNDAIEAAATILDSEFSRLFADAEKYRGGSNPHHEHKAFAEAAKKQATAIRALKRPTP